MLEFSFWALVTKIVALLIILAARMGCVSLLRGEADAPGMDAAIILRDLDTARHAFRARKDGLLRDTSLSNSILCQKAIATLLIWRVTSWAAARHS